MNIYDAWKYLRENPEERTIEKAEELAEQVAADKKRQRDLMTAEEAWSTYLDVPAPELGRTMAGIPVVTYYMGEPIRRPERHCPWCGGVFKEDKRGNCANCGGPQEEPARRTREEMLPQYQFRGGPPVTSSAYMPMSYEEWYVRSASFWEYNALHWRP